MGANTERAADVAGCDRQAAIREEHAKSTRTTPKTLASCSNNTQDKAQSRQ
jgi:hypothetical protein